MQLRKLTPSDPECENGNCPAVYISDRGTLVVQGDQVQEANGLTLGPGEQAVEISLDLLRVALGAAGH